MLYLIFFIGSALAVPLRGEEYRISEWKPPKHFDIDWYVQNVSLG